MRIYNHDMKHYKAQDGAMLTKSVITLICFVILGAWGYFGNQEYLECLSGNQSIVLCGGGNTK